MEVQEVSPASTCVTRQQLLKTNLATLMLYVFPLYDMILLNTDELTLTKVNYALLSGLLAWTLAFCRHHFFQQPHQDYYCIWYQNVTWEAGLCIHHQRR